MLSNLYSLSCFNFTTCSGDGKDLEFKEAIKRSLYLGGVFVFSDAIPALEWLDIGGYIKSMKQTFKEVDKVFEDWVRERIHTKNDESESDFLDAMLSAIPEYEMVAGYNRETVIKSTILVSTSFFCYSCFIMSVLLRITSIIMVYVLWYILNLCLINLFSLCVQILIMTGSESTAETVIWALSLLMNNPHTLKLAQDEIENNVGKERWVQESDVSNLNYLQAIFKETLRLYPPGPLSGPREALEDCHIGGYNVPKGTRLIANLWKLQRDPNVWSNPDEFRPERFLDENSQVNFKGQCFEYIPFSSGRRMCPGMMFGLQVIHLTLARLLQAFEFSTPNGEAIDMGEGLGIALPKLKPLDIVLTPRLPQELYENI